MFYFFTTLFQHKCGRKFFCQLIFDVFTDDPFTPAGGRELGSAFFLLLTFPLSFIRRITRCNNVMAWSISSVLSSIFFLHI